MAVLAVILIAYVLFPLVSNVTQSIATSELVEHNVSGETNHTLLLSPLESGSLSIAGLTVTSNYTVDYNTGLVNISNATGTGNYTLAYGYFDANYLDDTNERSLFRIVFVAAIIGLIYWLFTSFGI